MFYRVFLFRQGFEQPYKIRRTGWIDGIGPLAQLREAFPGPHQNRAIAIAPGFSQMTAITIAQSSFGLKKYNRISSISRDRCTQRGALPYVRVVQASKSILGRRCWFLVQVAQWYARRFANLYQHFPRLVQDQYIALRGPGILRFSLPVIFDGGHV